MSVNASHALLVIVATGCLGANPPGEVTIENHYTGPCALNVKFDEESNNFEPLATGATISHEFAAGIFHVGLRADGTVCVNQLCTFKDSQNFNLGGCGGYTADGFAMQVEITDETMACPGSQPPVVRPVATCKPAVSAD